MSSAPPPPPAPPGVLHLERFLESVLKKNLDTVLSQREELYNTVAQCAQLRWLMEDMQALSRYHSFVEAASAAEAASATSASAAAADGAAAVAPSTSNRISASSSSPVSKRAQANAYTPPQRNTILVDLGHHFYTQGVVRDASVVYVNLGCGVVLPMSQEEARAFLKKKESVVREMITSKSKEALRIKYRIRLVSEAIARLNESHLGL
ncbi:hypothetical protein ABB37_06956 [Leptomonas pyrrhocoris]|uniref:Prefoldin-like protein n=1 Tax=Leptomonas pyrrhocoris TaxID=157538 RepID=A0A0N0DTJ7_LEPPY|nr:hypothetical protein ABB37_06956 [Leptomonas pyrrhocoris]KPA77588.1 hypothetical protein ABB37_06956 [Leptomonas pyrrhocoris]|eukprot:XP_015656027.1 hypothetical protein ABB37_06956 [Leptomonas pyrrhocoris]